MLVIHKDFLPVLAYQVYVHFIDNSCQSGCNYFFSDTVHRPSMDGLRQLFRIDNSFGKQFHHIFVALTVCRRYVVADTDIATLKQGIQFGQFIDLLLVQVKNASVILTHALHYLIRHETATDEILHGTFGYPGSVTDITFSAGKLLDEVGVDQLQTFYVTENAPDGIPVNTGAFHSNFLNFMSKEKLMQLFQFRCQNTVLGFKFLTFFV